MKARLLLLLSVVSFAFACQQDAELSTTEQLLYRQWLLAETSVDDPNSGDYSASGIEYITFQAPGVILYGKDKADVNCCNPRYFIFRDGQLLFKDAPTYPLPEKINFGACAAVSCLRIPDSWTVAELTPAKLVIKTGRETRTYKPS